MNLTRTILLLTRNTHHTRAKRIMTNNASNGDIIEKCKAVAARMVVDKNITVSCFD